MGSAGDNLRVGQIFATRFVLEVCGGGGAIWGFSEVVKLRHPGTVDLWRINASVAGLTFFMRFLMQLLDFLRDKSRDNFNKIRLVQIFSARLVLEVFGGAGAIWGPAEAVKLRNLDTQEFFRVVSCIFGVLFFFRFCVQLRDFMKQMKGEVLPTTDPMLQFWQIFSVKLVLEVFGGAGAIWGFSEVVTLRNPATQEMWRFNALTVGFILLIRYFLQMKDFIIDVNFPDQALVVSKEEWMRHCQLHEAELALEVTSSPSSIPNENTKSSMSSSSSLSDCAPGRLSLSSSPSESALPTLTPSKGRENAALVVHPDNFPFYARARSLSANDVTSLMPPRSLAYDSKAVTNTSPSLGEANAKPSLYPSDNTLTSGCHLYNTLNSLDPSLNVLTSSNLSPSANSHASAPSSLWPSSQGRRSTFTSTHLAPICPPADTASSEQNLMPCSSEDTTEIRNVFTSPDENTTPQDCIATSLNTSASV